ncbi:adenosylcobalamin/alpha-ribazole phosphatase [Edwardsiella ictaluri]|uniref:adenosylcobalamin/alpha-ribazole phosphatase n=1 Tax=Edwardsiella ictaluri TaxID=67780 RepID=UPI0037830E5A
MELYLVRHGETQANRDGLYCGSSDVALTPQGLQQAQAVAHQLQGVAFDAAYASRLRRTQQTLRPIIGALEQFHVHAGLDEINFGEWELCHHRDLARQQSAAYRAWCDDWRSAVPPGGEGFAGFSAPVEAVLAELLARHEGQRVLVVSHQGVLSLLCARLLGMAAENMWHFSFSQGSHSLIAVRQGFAVMRSPNDRSAVN